MALAHEQRGFGATSRVDLVRLATDLSAPQTLASVELAPAGISGATFFDAVSAAVGSDRAWIAVEWLEHELSHTQAAVLRPDGSVAQGPAPAGDAVGLSGLGLPYAPGGAVRQRFRWDGESLDGWDVWAPGLAGEEGGPGASEIVTVYDPDSAALLEADPSSPGADRAPITVPAAEHPDLGVLGAPLLVFPAF